MRFQADFGNSNKKIRLAESGKFRLAVMGDFSRRANKGELAIVEDFSKLVGESTVKKESASSAIETLLKNATALYIKLSAGPRQDATVAVLDSALSSMKIGEIPFHYYMDSDGDRIALSCPEQLFTETQISRIVSQNLIQADSIKGKPEAGVP